MRSMRRAITRLTGARVKRSGFSSVLGVMLSIRSYRWLLSGVVAMIIAGIKRCDRRLLCVGCPQVCLHSQGITRGDTA